MELLGVILERGRGIAGSCRVHRGDVFKELLLMQAYAIDFWGPVSNFGIPVAAVMDTQKSPDL